MSCSRASLVLSVAIVVAALTARAHAGQATCSNPGVPVGAAASSELLPGRLTFSLTSGLLSISSEEILDDVGGSVRYDSRLILLETRLGADPNRPEAVLHGGIHLGRRQTVLHTDVLEEEPLRGQRAGDGERDDGEQRSPPFRSLANTLHASISA